MRLSIIIRYFRVIERKNKPIMKKTILFIALFAFMAASSIAVSTVYSDQNKVELSSGNEGDTKKR